MGLWKVFAVALQGDVPRAGWVLLALVVSVMWAGDVRVSGLQADEVARYWCFLEDPSPAPAVDIDAVLAGGAAGRKAAGVDRPDARYFRAMVDRPRDAGPYIDAARCLVTRNDPAAASRVLARALEIVRDQVADPASAPPGDRPAASTTVALRGTTPTIRLSRNATGTVFVELVVGRRGEVRRARVVGPSSPGVERMVLTDARTWTFDPTLVDGKPVEVTAVLPIRLTPTAEPSSADAMDTARFRYGQRQFDQAADALAQAVTLVQHEAEARRARFATQLANGIVVIDEKGPVPPPAITKRVEPELPAIARAAKLTGIARVEVLIGQDGKVLDAKAVSGVPILAEVAWDAVRQWEFAPTIVNGKPVAVRMTIAVQLR